MKKWFIGIFIASFLVLAGVTKVKADNNFSINSTVTYRVEPSGQTRVTHDISLTNLNSSYYATSYALALSNIDVQNISAQDLNGTSIPLITKKEGDSFTITLNFSDQLVGKGNSRRFNVSYDNLNFAIRTGEVWEISIPKLGTTDTFGDYNVTLVVPDSMGLEAYVSPKADTYKDVDGYKYYSFSKNGLTQTGITAGFGQFQVFSFNLYYHLENPLPRSAETTVSIPPDTAYQRMYFSKITPEPETVQIDEDGNWIAKYRLSARQRLDVNVVGSVQIFAGYRSFPKPSEAIINANLKDQEYWEVSDPKIKELASRLKTPEKIYSYVATTLKYDFGRVQPNVQRLGAKGALEHPSNAICMEFTDLFIAIARAAGIPAREINGYAYTENKDLQPLGLVADVLHSWPEYYDKEKGVWIPVDPTWGSTSGGVDYFNKLDLRHFTFVIHGESSGKPYPPGSYKLGANPQKDVFVSFGQLPEKRVPQANITLTPYRNIPFLNTLYLLKIKNPGPSSIESISPTVYFDSKISSKDFVNIMPPYSYFEKIVSVPYSFLAKNTPNSISVQAGSSKIEVPINKSSIILNSLLVFFFAFLIILVLILIRIKRFTLHAKIIAKIKSLKPS